MDDPIEMIKSERVRQVAVEGYSYEHDDQHFDGQIADAAACYAAGMPIYTYFRFERDQHQFINMCPRGWALKQDERRRLTAGRVASNSHKQVVEIQNRNKERIRDLVKAGALIVAEIERIQRHNPQL